MNKRFGSVCLAAVMAISAIAMSGCGTGGSESSEVKTIKIWSVNGHT